MNVYVQFGLAMCVIVAISLVATAYLAASMNRRAKADLETALAPLAEVIGGEVKLDDAEVVGSFAGHLAFGRMANASEGPGRVFQTDLIDPAGGVAWRFTSDPGKRRDAPQTERLDSDGERLKSDLAVRWSDLASRAVNPRTDRYRVDYEPGAGRLRFSRPMRTRRDIPDRTAFAGQLEMLVALGPINRAAQGAPDAGWAGGRRDAAASNDG